MCTFIFAGGAFPGTHLYIPESAALAPCIRRWIVVWSEAFSVMT